MYAYMNVYMYICACMAKKQRKNTHMYIYICMKYVDKPCQSNCFIFIVVLTIFLI